MKYVQPIGAAANAPYIDADPGAGIEGSPVPAAAIEYPMREIMAVIAAAGIAPSDANLAQLLAALRSAGVFQTPTQYDGTTKPATTEFVQRALGNTRGAVGYSVSATLGDADVGKLVSLGGSGAKTLTLPNPAGRVGCAYWLVPFDASGTWTVVSPTYLLGGGRPFATSIALSTLETVVVVSDGAGWMIFCGSSSGTGITPPQFDNSTKLATTEFVKRAQGANSTFFAYGTNQTLTAAHVGGLVQINSPSTQTLPLESTCTNGSRIEFICVGGTATIVRQGTNNILTPLLGTLTSITLNAGDTLVVESYGGTGNWYICGGSAALRYTTDFGASLSAAGYQKLPSGLIFQWATGSTTTAGDQDQTITFPITFPNACLHLAVSTKAGSTTLSDSWIQERSTTNSSCVVCTQWNGTGALSGGMTPRIFAIGW